MVPRLYLAMAGECIDQLDHDERAGIDTKVFAKLMHICAEVADRYYRAPVSVLAAGVPHPPEMGFVRAYMLRPGDRVLRPDVSFSAVEAINVESERTGDVVYVTWMGGKVQNFDYLQPVRIASNRAHADEWNTRRSDFDGETIEKLMAAYGNAKAVM